MEPQKNILNRKAKQIELSFSYRLKSLKYAIDVAQLASESHDMDRHTKNFLYLLKSEFSRFYDIDSPNDSEILASQLIEFCKKKLIAKAPEIKQIEKDLLSLSPDKVANLKELGFMHFIAKAQAAYKEANEYLSVLEELDNTEVTGVMKSSNLDLLMYKLATYSEACCK
jgi:hypothetical protein